MQSIPQGPAGDQPTTEADDEREKLKNTVFDATNVNLHTAMQDLQPASYEIAKTAALEQLNTLRTQITFFDWGERETFRDAVCRLNAKKAARKEHTVTYIGAIVGLGIISGRLIHSPKPGLQGTGYGVAALAGLLLLRLIYNRWQAPKVITKDNVLAKMDELSPVYSFIRRAPRVETNNAIADDVLKNQENADRTNGYNFKKAYTELSQQNDWAKAKLFLTLSVANLFGLPSAGCIANPRYGTNSHHAAIALCALSGLMVFYALYDFSRSKTAITPTTIAAKLDDCARNNTLRTTTTYLGM